MSQYGVIFVIVGMMLLSSTNDVHGLPVINCEPNSISEAPAGIRQLCYYVRDILRSDPPQDNANYFPVDDVMAKGPSERGIKRQDVDHVFLRFGKRFGY